MDEARLAHFKSVLKARRDELRAHSQASAASRDAVALDQQSVGRVSRVDALQAQAMAQAQERNRARELTRIEQALSRMQEGEFGYCVECGNEIAPARLEVDPAALLCIACARNAGA